MGPSTARSRAQFLTRLRAITGAPTRLWMPKLTDTVSATTDDAVAATITWDATVAARLSSRGYGVAQSFVSASSQFGSMPDANDLSFGNGAADSALTFLAVANVTDTAAVRALLSKFAAANNEYIFGVSAADALFLNIYDNSAAVAAARTSNAAITQGAWCLFGVTYDGTGGTTAANGIALYQNGVAMTSTPTNNASYVAMENLAAVCEIGSSTSHTVQFLDGSLALIGIYPTALSAAAMAQAYAACRSQFRI